VVIVDPGQHLSMTTVSRTFPVTPSRDVVLDYLKDFSHAQAWDPGTQSCTRIDSGPVLVGSTWRNVSRFAGRTTELIYTLERLSEETIVLVGRNDAATSTDTITIEPSESGSQITYRAVLELHGAARFASPVVKLLFEKIANDTVRQMTEVLNQL
jgi:carbon monoxide dehydrogenase subunit G